MVLASYPPHPAQMMGDVGSDVRPQAVAHEMEVLHIGIGLLDEPS